MIIDRELLEEYPFEGEFFEKYVDETLPLDQQMEEERTVLKTRCDIQESKKTDSGGNISATFNVYFPFDKGKGINVVRGMSFRGSMCNMRVSGIVVGVFPTQLGGCSCYVKDVNV